ncbi:putative membrane translocator [Actinacidiphila reveromycinica]|uniref:Putative membrane translocator n=1 Tax=Actinacidiphila reveromycinica TaxID=659352 RepID=A0A7U3V0B2_9ACTN|nr:lanthionine synthetase C family protein [Streptomyces sp. SN-593]BBB01884.1 putative membrane translocator [Streptomyces sp. SN-593]
MSVDVFTFADPDFYVPPSAVADRGPHLRPAAAPDGWTAVRTGWWTGWTPASGPRFGDGDLRVYASAGPEPLQPVLDAFAAACFARGVPFRHVANQSVHHHLNHPRGSRAQAGRFCVAAPADAAAAEDLVRALHAAAVFAASAAPAAEAHQQAAPTVRHGRVPAPSASAVRPDGTRSTEDYLMNAPAPTPVAPAGFEVRGLRAASTDGYSFTARNVMDGSEVFVKQALPQAAPAGDGRSAADRLRAEWRVLARVHHEAPGLCPRPLVFVEGRPYPYLLAELVAGVPLTSWVVANSPVADPAASAGDWSRYHRRAADLIARIERDLRRLWLLGYPVDGVEARDVLVDRDDGIRLTGGLTRGTASGADTDGAARRGGADGPSRTAARLGLLLLTPLAPVAERNPGVLPHILRDLTERAPVPPRLWHAATRPADSRAGAGVPLPSPEQVDADERGALTELRDRVAAGILDAAADRPWGVFPSVPQGYETNTLGVAYGTAGVVHALRTAGVDIPAWITRRLREDALRQAGSLPPGLYSGLAGIAWVLADLGFQDEARDLLGAADRHPLTRDSATLAWGASGVAMAHLALYGHSRDASHLDRAVELTRLPQRSAALSARLGPHDMTGLFYGRAGVAHALQQVGAVTGEDRLRRGALRLLHAELDRARQSAGGELVFPVSAKDRRGMYYLHCGTAGFLTAASRALAAAPDERLALAVPRLVAKSSITYVAHAGLFQGLAGLGFALAECGRLLDDERARAASWRSARTLFAHALPSGGAVRFLGDLRLRQSCELWSGASGVLLFLSHLLDQRPDPLFSVDSLARDAAAARGRAPARREPLARRGTAARRAAPAPARTPQMSARQPAARKP